MSELPKGWEQTKLFKVTEIIMGQSPPSDTYNTLGQGLPFFQGKAEFGDLFPTVRKYCSSPLKVAQANDILISVRAPVGPTNIAQKASCIGRGLAAIRPISEIQMRYILYFLRNIESWLSTQGTGSTFTAISKSDIEDIDISIAPLNEQHRIVEKLEKLLSKVDACQKRLDRIPVILKRFRQAVLAAACSGKLTADWREKDSQSEPLKIYFQNRGIRFLFIAQEDTKLPELPPNWLISNFGTVVESIRGGSTAVPQNEPTRFPILRSSSVRPGFVDFGDVKYLSQKQSENDLNYLHEGDLLFTRLSGSLEYVANCAKVRGLGTKKIQYPDRLFCAKLLSSMNASYIELVFASPYTRAHIIEQAKSSAGHQRVSISDITGQPIPLPPLEEQQEIVRRVEELFKYADQIEARYKKAKAHVDKLTQSILAKAFRGELVPQDPTDEPASVLLERIQKERSAKAILNKKARPISTKKKQASLFDNQK
jgi:type I restriction enzyme S subunit